MCFRCPSHSPDSTRELLESHKDLQEFEAAFDRTLYLANQIEDKYRRAGLSYHFTQIEARQPSNFPQGNLDMLKEIFEITRAEEYLAIFAKLHDTVKALSDLRSSHLRYSGTPEVLIHRIYGILEPGLDALDGELQVYWAELSDRLKDADTLFDISRAMHESENQGRRCAWQDASGPDPDYRPVPSRKGDEWKKYHAWVWSLPETQRSVAAGRTVDEVALELLYYEPEDLVV
jgi:hypothetical protein